MDKTALEPPPRDLRFTGPDDDERLGVDAFEENRAVDLEVVAVTRDLAELGDHAIRVRAIAREARAEAAERRWLDDRGLDFTVVEDAPTISPDLPISRALVELFSREPIANALAFRGGTALNLAA